MKCNDGAATALTLLLAGLASCSAPAWAQYMWLDDKGGKQLSDRPPPLSVPASRIFKSPRQAPAAGPVVVPSAAAAPDAIPPPATTTADREADFQQRRKAAAAAENKAAGEERDRAAQATNCHAARQNQRALDGGGAIVSYDDNGERSVMDDRQREELAKNTQKVLSSCK